MPGQFFRYLRNVTVEGGFGKPDIAFSSDGTLKSVELKIMNLRPGISSNLVWEVVRIFSKHNPGLFFLIVSKVFSVYVHYKI